jgi:hypothetical protein
MEPKTSQRNHLFTTASGTPAQQRGRPMENKDRYRSNAEECIRLAQSAKPQHKAALLEMAETWRRLAEEMARQKPSSRKEAG